MAAGYTVPQGKKEYILSADGLDKYDELIKKYIKDHAGTDVSVDQIQSTGVKIATITVDGEDTDIYAPEDQTEGHIYSSENDALAEGTKESIGELNRTYGKRSHAEGIGTIASGEATHAEGRETKAGGFQSHAEGYQTTAWSRGGHAEGVGTYVDKSCGAGHAEGYHTQVLSPKAHAEGQGGDDPSFSAVENVTIRKVTTEEKRIFDLYGLPFNYVAEDNNLEDNISGWSIYSGKKVEDGKTEYTGKVATVLYARYNQGEWGSKLSDSGDWLYLNNVIQPGTYHFKRTGGVADAYASHVEGTQNITLNGNSSHAEGVRTLAYGDASHTEGSNTVALDEHSHAEGDYTLAGERAAHAEGNHTIATGRAAHSEGQDTIAYGDNSHTEGSYSYACGKAAHSEGDHTKSTEHASHAEGTRTLASGQAAHAEGGHTIASGDDSHAEGTGEHINSFTVAIRKVTSNERTALNRFGLTDINYVCERQSDQGTIFNNLGKFTIHRNDSDEDVIGEVIYSRYNSAEDEEPLIEKVGIDGTKFRLPKGDYLRLDTSTLVNGSYFFKRIGGKSEGTASHTEGSNTIASNNSAHAEGYKTQASGSDSHTEGSHTIALGENAHAEGDRTLAIESNSHAEGKNTVACGSGSHAEGTHTFAIGDNSHAEGSGGYALGLYSHVSGRSTIARNNNETAIGRFNISREDNTVFTTGIGEYEDRKNAFEIHSDGRIYLHSIDLDTTTYPNWTSLKNDGKELNHSLQWLLNDLNKRVATLESRAPGVLTRANVQELFNSNTGSETYTGNNV